MRSRPRPHRFALTTAAALFSLGWCAATAGAATNYALGKPTTVSSTYQTYSASNAVDGVVSDASRWLGAATTTSNWITINLGGAVTLRQAHVYSGYQTQAGSWITNLQFQAWSGAAWTNIPGAATSSNNLQATILNFSAPVTTTQIRLLISDTAICRLREITLWDQAVPLYTGVVDGNGLPFAVAPTVFVNQIGYQIGAPMRGTAPTVPDNTPFTLTATNSTNALLSGVVLGHRADFSAFAPARPGPYLLRVWLTNQTLVSDPFLVATNLLAARMIPPAVEFMVDSRSAVGTHPSAYGGCPWRDGTYYSFEIPSLIYLLLNFPDTIRSLPQEVNYETEKAKVLAPAFTNTYVALAESTGFLEALRRYYTSNAPPLKTNTPDAVQGLHFGLGVTLERPATKDPSGDPRPQQIHAQTVEWCAFFLHAWPQLRQWLPDAFYHRVHDFAFTQWTNSAPNDPSSLEIDPLWSSTNYNATDPYKGRHVPGHSILPNLLMYQVAQREGRSNATNFLNAARLQAQWVVDKLDWNDPRVTKGQRMSEHKLMPGLAYFVAHFPNEAPPGLAAKIQSWVDTAIARSDNLWDFRRYELTNDWSIPALTSSWNEPGNLAGFPACALSAAAVIGNPAQKQRLRELSWAALDCLFGRNPLGAITDSHPQLGFPDAERGWPSVYTGAAAYLENCRGTINSSPGTEMFPYNPAGAFRHAEGWVNFNAAWNVGLAYLQADLTGADPLTVHLPIVISELLPAPAGDLRAEYLELFNPTAYPARLSGLTLGGSVALTFPTNSLTELAPGVRCLVVRDLAAFTNQFGAGLPVVGTFTGDLPDAGGTLTLGDVNGNTFATFNYGGSNLVAGFSLVFAGTETNFPAGPWQHSALPAGSPGLAEPAPMALSAVAISWSEVALSWTRNFANDARFVIERSPGTNGPWLPAIATGLNASNAVNFGLAPATTYAYRIKAVFATGSSSAYALAPAVVTPAATPRPPIVVLPLGDSITQGASQPASVPGGYRSPLFELLTNAGYRVQFVGSYAINPSATLTGAGNASHEGHGGYTTTNLLDNLDGDGAGTSGNNGGHWLDGLAGTRPPVYPDVILLLAGVNDLGVNQLSAAQGLAGLDALLNKLAALRPAARVVVSTLTPYIGAVYPLREQHEEEFNAALPALVAAHHARGQRVTLCDARTRIDITNAPALLCSDGVHPNQAGYNALAQMWFAAFPEIPLLETWRTGYFGSPANTGNAADAADWDGDGWSNLYEYAVGSNPTNAASVNPVVTNFVTDGGTNYLSLTFPRRKLADVSYRVEAVAELTGAVLWSNQVVQVGAPISRDADFEQVTVRDTVPANTAPARFMRLKIVAP